jgi:hypothetical protein
VGVGRGRNSVKDRIQTFPVVLHILNSQQRLEDRDELPSFSGVAARVSSRPTRLTYEAARRATHEREASAAASP